MFIHPEDWPRVKEVFGAALALPADARLDYLVDACGGDQTLRKAVDALLVSHEQAKSFLETPPRTPILAADTEHMDGRRIGPYELSTRIGSGGMGDVYKARDTRLNRIVAIKVLPSAARDDALARDRFEREAHAVAALNHPHICTLHDVGTADGMTFLVMEYLEGETVAERLTRGSLPIPQALQYGIQIAAALDAVHRAGIVHRDLKPGNVMLTRAGAKLLDFGLSKAETFATVTGQAPWPVSPLLTSAGVILGTVPYMAPEQLDGLICDARTDIFTFGAVLYEMMAGTKAFDGNSYASMVTAIREHEPAPQPSFPPPVDRIVRACLAKDKEDRWQTARDLLRELRWTAEAGSLTGVESSAVPIRRGRATRWIAAAAIVIAVGAAGGYGYLTGDSPATVRFHIITAPTNDPMSFALSPDGRQLTYVATADGESKLWARSLDQVRARVLDGTNGASYPFWSPDGQAIGFFADGKLKRLDVDGGLPVVLADAPTGRGGTWNRNGTIVFAPVTAGPLMRISATGGIPVAVTVLAAGQNSHRWPQFLPDSRHFVFLSTQGEINARGVFVGALDGSIAPRLLDDDSPAMYAPPGRLLLVRRGALVAVPFDASRGAVTGEPAIVAQPIGLDTGLSRAGFAVSDAGVIAHRAAIAGPRQLVWRDRAGTVLGTFGPVDEDAMAAPTLAPDAQSAAVFRTVNGNADVWMVQRGGMLSRFTFHDAADTWPLWSPDGQRIVFSSNRVGSNEIFEKALHGDDGELLLLRTNQVKIPTDFSRDGRMILYAVQVPGTGVDIWALPLDGDKLPFSVVQTPYDEMAAQFSPDRRWIAYQSNASGRMEVYWRPFRGAGGRQMQLSLAGGSQARWRPDGKELFYIGADGRMMAVPIRIRSDINELEAGIAAPLFPTALAAGANVPGAVGSRQQYAVAPDGRFLMNASVDVATAPPITVELNWQAGLQR